MAWFIFDAAEVRIADAERERERESDGINSQMVDTQKEVQLMRHPLFV